MHPQKPIILNCHVHQVVHTVVITEYSARNRSLPFAKYPRLVLRTDERAHHHVRGMENYVKDRMSHWLVNGIGWRSQRKTNA